VADKPVVDLERTGAGAAVAAVDDATRSRPDGGDEPPVVARLVVEVRSDGSRTVARGVLEDLVTGERTAVEARGGTPLGLAASLARRLLTAPLLARRAGRALRGLLPGRTDGPR
jgi:hypothetical protein